MPKVHDYDALEREYIASDISIRELCRKHGIPGFSGVAAYARDHGWADKRARVKERTTERAVQKIAEKQSDAIADHIESFRDESLILIRSSIYRFAEQLRDPEFRLRADDLVKLINLGLVITGQPTARVEERHLDLVATFDGLPADVLRQLADATRPVRTDEGADRATPRASAPGTRPN